MFSILINNCRYIIVSINCLSEADILPNWSKSEDWRGDVRYAAMVAKVILDYQKFVVKKRRITMELLSNDNCFLNYHPYYFTQRTLLTR